MRRTSIVLVLAVALVATPATALAGKKKPVPNCHGQVTAMLASDGWTPRAVADTLGLDGPKEFHRFVKDLCDDYGIDGTFAEIDGMLPSVTVLTRNLYVGANVFRLFQPHPFGIPGAVADLVATVDKTDFPARAEALADEIEAAGPHLVGLQEVSLLRAYPSDFSAETVLYDYLDILLAALDDRGLDYRIAAQVQDADVTLPRLIGITPGGEPILDYVRLTDRDVILARGDVTTENEIGTQYAAAVPIPVTETVTVNFFRGYAAVDATVNGYTYRFVNTHLEVGSAEPVPFNYFQGLQAQELMATLASEELPIILLGDFNSDPMDPIAPAYSIISGAGYSDVWTTLDDPGPGYTYGFSELLDDSTEMPYERIDLIWTRDGMDLEFKSATGYVVGADPVLMVYSAVADDDLWPSDHAGVVATIRMMAP